MATKEQLESQIAEMVGAVDRAVDARLSRVITSPYTIVIFLVYSALLLGAGFIVGRGV